MRRRHALAADEYSHPGSSDLVLTTIESVRSRIGYQAACRGLETIGAVVSVGGLGSTSIPMR